MQGPSFSLQGKMLCEDHNMNSWENWPDFDDTKLEINQIDGSQLS